MSSWSTALTDTQIPDSDAAAAPPPSTASYAPPQGPGGLRGYLAGVVRRLPRALATMSAGMGNPYPLHDIEEQERREDQQRQQQFANTITAQRENRANQLYDYQLQNFKAELAKRQFDQQEVQRKALNDKQTRDAQTAAAAIPPEYIHPDGHLDASKLPPEIAQRYLQITSGKEFSKPDTMTRPDGSVVQWDENTRMWKPSMLRLPNPQASADQMYGGGPGRQGPPPAMAPNYVAPPATVDVPMTGFPKAVNVKELLQTQLNQAAQEGDKAKVAELQQRLRDIDPTGEDRIRMAEDNAQRAREKFDVDYPIKADGQRVHNVGAGKSRADAATALIPVINRVRELLQDPEVVKGIGVLPGTVSEAERRMGNLPRKVRELYGTLKSEYSLAGTMHGWRALQVAEEFEKAYGGLRSNAESLRGGLDAMETTARAVMGAVGENDGSDEGDQQTPKRPTRPPKPGYKWQRHRLTNELREVPVTGTP